MFCTDSHKVFLLSSSVIAPVKLIIASHIISPFILINLIFIRYFQFQKIVECITENVIATGDKAIVVSQFANVLNMFGVHLKKFGIKYVMLTGETKISSRNDIVTNFNSSNSSTQVKSIL